MMASSHLLHGLAIATLYSVGRTRHGLNRTMAIVRSVARLMPPVDRRGAQKMASRLRSGTCLTRSMVIAARWPASEVVVAVRAPTQQFGAHAWVERDGIPLTADEVTEQVILRFA